MCILFSKKRIKRVSVGLSGFVASTRPTNLLLFCPHEHDNDNLDWHDKSPLYLEQRPDHP
ncbi:unknown protein [Microcystis aeruginosa NIES-843]|uniref:Uncharacterized protein n=1 Tax=Microcystis aeruginosa (strain NIES-843 / IAM M-2473) TaxID=449447 RepID=B0JSZ4_MICAN|nr:unknown protein [Microcystis aeruginosa NIES-843]